jgi:hypothetical protein
LAAKYDCVNISIGETHQSGQDESESTG